MKKAVGIFIMAICLVGLSLTTLYAEVIEVTYLPLYVVANSPYTTPVAQTVVLIGATTGTRITGLTTANFTLRGVSLGTISDYLYCNASRWRRLYNNIQTKQRLHLAACIFDMELYCKNNWNWFNCCR